MFSAASAFSDYKKDDFLNDDFFIRTIKYPTPESNSFWRKWLIDHPHQLNVWEDAREELVYLIRSIKKKPILDNEEKSRIWKNIADRLPSINRQLIRQKFFRRIAVAASFTMFLVSVSILIIQYYQNRKILYDSAFEHVEYITLPDSTYVILNSGSKIEYKKAWDKNKPREVWLSGEAYFEVKHRNKDVSNVSPHDRFIIHSDNLEVEVLGTTFNIYDRKDISSVSLIDGKVKVRKKGEIDWSVLLPGEQFEIRTDMLGVVVKNAFTVPSLTAWHEKSILLSDTTTFDNIIPRLENFYGVKIVLVNPRLGERQISGNLSLGNKDDLFFIFETVLDLHVTQKNNTWYINQK